MSVSQHWNQASLTLVEWATTTSTSKQASKRTGLAASFLIAEMMQWSALPYSSFHDGRRMAGIAA